MPKYVAVNPVAHKTTRILDQRSEALGDGVMCCLTVPEEFRNVQGQYPILFQLGKDRKSFACVALFGFEDGENLYLREGRWDATYVPLAMDVHPFMIGLSETPGDVPKVVFDEESPRVSMGEGRRLFDDNGVATNFLENISKKLDYLDGCFKRSGGFLEALQLYGLLEPLTIDVTLKDGSLNRLVGFHTIHEEKLAELEPSALTQLHASGYLLPIYMAVASLSNLAGLISRKDQKTV